MSYAINNRDVYFDDNWNKFTKKVLRKKKKKIGLQIALKKKGSPYFCDKETKWALCWR